MKKLTSIWLIIMVMIFLGISSLAEARTGNTSDSSSSKSRTTTSKSVSKSTKTTSATNSIFSNTAKVNEAKKAWQERNKKVVKTPVANIPAPVQDNNASRRQEEQLTAIQRQIAEAKRQQQIIAAAQTAAQIALSNNNRPQPTVSTPDSTLPTAPANNAGISWFMIFLMLGGIVLVFFWFKKRNTSNTIYRL